MSEINSIANGTYTIGQTSANDSSLLVTKNENNVSILSTQQEVSHDSSLSGNGTVDSLLGVNLSAVAQLLGIDETVLYSTTAGTVTTAFTLSEAASGFDKIRYEWKWNNTVDNATMNTIINLDSRSFNLFSMAAMPDNNKYYTVGRFEYDEKYRNLSYVSGWQEANSVPTTATNQSKSISILKIIGIGRKQ